MGTLSKIDTKVIVRGLDETVAYTKEQWFEVAQQMKPGITEAEYDVMWDEFCLAKAKHLRECNT